MAKSKKNQKKVKKGFKSYHSDVKSNKVNDIKEDDDQSAESESDIENEDISEETHLLCSINVLNVLGRRFDLYESKAMKQLRTALFPLIQIQIKKNSHFEAKLITVFNDINNDATKMLTSKRLGILSKTASRYASDQDLFLSPEHKLFREALHPLVMLQQRRMSGDTSTITTEEKGNQSYSNRVSAAFRARGNSSILFSVSPEHF